MSESVSVVSWVGKVSAGFRNKRNYRSFSRFWEVIEFKYGVSEMCNINNIVRKKIFK